MRPVAERLEQIWNCPPFPSRGTTDAPSPATPRVPRRGTQGRCALRLEFVPFTLTQATRRRGGAGVGRPCRGADSSPSRRAFVVRDHLPTGSSTSTRLVLGPPRRGADLRRRDVVAGVLEACGSPPRRCSPRSATAGPARRSAGPTSAASAPMKSSACRPSSRGPCRVRPAHDQSGHRSEDPAALIERLVTMLIGQPELKRVQAHDPQPLIASGCVPRG